MTHPFLRKIGVFINAKIRNLQSPLTSFSHSSYFLTQNVSYPGYQRLSEQIEVCPLQRNDPQGMRYEALPAVLGIIRVQYRTCDILLRGEH